MESRNMTEQEFAEFQKLLERELGAVGNTGDEEEIAEMLRHDPSAQLMQPPASTVQELRRRQEERQKKEKEEAEKAAQEQAAAIAAAMAASAPGKYEKIADAAPAADQIPEQTPVTRGKYEKAPEDYSEETAPKADNLLKKPGKYEKVTEEAEGYFNPELPKESAAQRRRRARKNARITRIVIGLAALFVLSLGAGLIVNTINAKRDISQQEAMASQQATDAEGNIIAETPTENPCSILGITPMKSFVSVLENDTCSLQVSMTTRGEASASDLLWESSDPAVAEVSDTGVVRGISSGRCTITISAKADSSINTQIECAVRTSEEKDGITYIDGILVLNKTYGAPENYGPGGLTEETQAAFDELCAAAAEDGLNIYLASGYRSYYTQQELYNDYVYTYGQDIADTFSARPGHSEHQSGLAIDVNTIDDAFGATPEAAWLAEHCHEYGFIIRYAEDKVDITGYKYEPWHIRYVGKEIAAEVSELGIALEEYLGIDSVYAEEETEE